MYDSGAEITEDLVAEHIATRHSKTRGEADQREADCDPATRNLGRSGEEASMYQVAADSKAGGEEGARCLACGSFHATWAGAMACCSKSDVADGSNRVTRTTAPVANATADTAQGQGGEARKAEEVVLPLGRGYYDAAGDLTIAGKYAQKQAATADTAQGPGGESLADDEDWRRAQFEAYSTERNH